MKFTKQVENEHQYVHVLYTHLETTLNGAFFENTIFLENVPHKAHLKGHKLDEADKNECNSRRPLTVLFF